MTAMDERVRIVAWLRAQGAPGRWFEGAKIEATFRLAADAIERGDHMPDEYPEIERLTLGKQEEM